MTTFQGTITKDRLLEEIKKHREADQIIKGTYGSENGRWRGCAVGCSIHSINALKKKDYNTSDHHVYEVELGIPEWLARLEDTLFEGLPDDKALLWPERFTQAIPIGVTTEHLDQVKWRFTAFLMQNNIDRVKTLDLEPDLKNQVIAAIEQVKQLNEDAITHNAAESAWSAARSAARSAAWSAARSAAWSAAWSAARSAESAAWSAARSAESAESAAESAESAARSARSAAYEVYADKLIELLEATQP